MQIRSVLKCLSAIAFSACVFAQEIVNARVKVSVDATGSVARSQTVLYMRNDGPDPVSTVTVTAGGRTSAIVVLEGDRIAKGVSRLKATFLGIEDVSAEVERASMYSVELKKPIQVGEEQAILISHAVLDAIEPSPKELNGKETHFVRYSGSSFFLSKYPTEEFAAEVKLAGRPVDGVFVAPEPAQLSEKVLQLGPYRNVPPFAQHPISVRFPNDDGFLVASSAVREMYVSHWGNVAVKEEFSLRNDAARHVGEWARADYQNPLSSSETKAAIGDVWANLPREATNVVYKDLVGNITTSRLRQPGSKSRPFQLTFRFPLLGGWKNYFWYSYDVPLAVFARSFGSSHRLKVPVFPSVNEKFVCDRLQIRVLLPEGASAVDISKHSTIAFEESQSVERTTLNYFGRRVVTLTADNVYTNQALHPSTVTITYNFGTLNLLITPLLVATGIFAFFVAIISFARLDFTLVSERDDVAAARAADVVEQEVRAMAVVQSMDAQYLELDYLVSKIGSAGGGGESTASRRIAIESKLKSLEAELSRAASELKRLGGASAELVGALHSRFGKKRDASMSAFTAHVLLKEGRLSREAYRGQVESTFSPSLLSVSHEIEALVDALSDGV